MSLADCRIRWDAGAVLQEVLPTTRALAWAGNQFYDGTIAGALEG